MEENYYVHYADSRILPLPSARNVFFDATLFDVIINLAGIFSEGKLSEYNLLTKKLIDVNCLGAVNILAEFLPKMNKGGRIILFSSVYSAINVPGMGVYSASKAFVDKLVKIAALENPDITVNSIQLGYTGIGMGASTPKNMAKAKGKTTKKRFVTIEEIYNTIEYIINTDYLTGQNIRLDGGIR